MKHTITKRVLPLLLSLVMLLTLIPPLAATATQPILTPDTDLNQPVYRGNEPTPGTTVDRETTATVYFKSTEVWDGAGNQGTYWYVVTLEDAGDTLTPAQIKTSPTDSGTLFPANLKVINGITTAAHSVYIVGEDKIHDVLSDVLKLDIPAFDGTPPALTPGGVNRTSNSNATVEFDSNEAGTYFYIVHTAAAPATKDAFNELATGLVNEGSGYAGLPADGFPMLASTNTITLTAATLSAGAKSISILALDAQGNASVITIAIPAYDASTPYTPPPPPATTFDGTIDLSWTNEVMTAKAAASGGKFSYDGDRRIEITGSPITITGSTNINKIIRVIDASNPIDITLSNAYIEHNEDSIGMRIENSTVNLTLTGGNSIKVRNNNAISLITANLSISGEGSLLLQANSRSVNNDETSTLTINGGTITAINKVTDSFAISGGGNVIITGCSLKVTGGAGTMGVQPVNAEGDPVYPGKLGGQTYVMGVWVNNINWPIAENHPDDDSLYLWLPANMDGVTVKTSAATYRGIRAYTAKYDSATGTFKFLSEVESGGDSTNRSTLTPSDGTGVAFHFTDADFSKFTTAFIDGKAIAVATEPVTSGVVTNPTDGAVAFKQPEYELVHAGTTMVVQGVPARKPVSADGIGYYMPKTVTITVKTQENASDIATAVSLTGAASGGTKTMTADLVWDYTYEIDPRLGIIGSFRNYANVNPSAQTFTAYAKVELPKNVANPSNIPLDVKVIVSTIANRKPVLTGGNVVAASLYLGGTYELDYKALFSDPDGDKLSYTYSIDGQTRQNLTSDFSFTPDAEGFYVLRFDATDREGSNRPSPDFLVSLTVTTMTLQDQINEAKSGTAANPTVITLSEDVALTSCLIIGKEGDPPRHITLTGNHTITRAAGLADSMIWVRAGNSLTLNGITLNGYLGGARGYAIIRNNGTLNIVSGTLTGNYAQYGGAVWNAGTVNMSGGTITGNHAGADGGGIANLNTVNISGGTISGNKADDDGGGIHSLQTVNMTGGTIENNTAKNGGGVLVHYGTFNLTNGKIEKNTAQNCGGGVVIQKDGVFNLQAADRRYRISGNTASLGGGGVYNSGKMTMTNGFIFNNSGGTGGGGIFNTATLTVNGGEISGNTAQSGGGISSLGKLTINGTSIIGNAASAQGGGVYSHDNSTTIMTSGSISDNKANQYGGGVSSSGTFTMSGGSIERNTASMSGGGVHFSYVFNMSGTSRIGENSATMGGGVHFSVGRTAKLTMQGGEIVNNKASAYGGGVYTQSVTATFLMSGGVIAGNTAKELGGGVYNYGEMYMTGGLIGAYNGKGAANNANRGGGVYNTRYLSAKSPAKIVGNNRDVDTDHGENVKEEVESSVTKKNAAPGGALEIKTLSLGGKSIGTAEPGSVIINFDNEFLKTLTNGEHSVTIALEDGATETIYFTIAGNLYFNDVYGDSWYYDDVLYVAANGLFNGTSATPPLFSPSKTMTRGMFVTVLGRMSGVELSMYEGEAYSDVAADMYYAPAILWAKLYGIIPDGDIFKPDAPITRQDLADFLYRFSQRMRAELPDAVSPGDFTDDGDISDYAREAVYALQHARVINGKPGMRFDPKGTATRAEVAAILRRFLEATE